jgi:hypothetical protein
LLRYIGTTYCWGSGPAKNATIETEVRSSFSCSLETFIESRISEWIEVPYNSQESLTAFGQGYAPQPWELPVAPVPHFVPMTEILEVPFTSTIRFCDGCHGTSKISCRNCGGRGTTRCNHCGGDGKITIHRGNRHQRCSCCHGDGKIKCHSQGVRKN